MMTSPKTGSFLHRLQPLQKLLNPFSILFTLTLSLSLLVHGCSVSQNEQLKPLQIGITTWPGFDIVLYAQEAGLFEKRGLDIQFTRFDNQQDSSRAVLRGSLDAAFASLWDVMQVDPGNNTPVFIMTTNVSAGSDGLVSQKGIKSVKELVNKRVGAKLGTVNHLILLEALKLHQINPEDVIIEDIPNELAAEKMKNGDLDAAVLWQPLLGNIAQEIKGNVIFTTKDVDSLVVDGLVSSSTLLESHQK